MQTYACTRAHARTCAFPELTQHLPLPPARTTQTPRHRACSSEMHEATRRLLGVLLRQLDGFQTGEGGKTVVLGATNRKQDLDPALLSRFDASITFQLPSCECRCRPALWVLSCAAAAGVGLMREGLAGISALLRWPVLRVAYMPWTVDHFLASLARSINGQEGFAHHGCAQLHCRYGPLPPAAKAIAQTFLWLFAALGPVMPTVLCWGKGACACAFVYLYRLLHIKPDSQACAASCYANPCLHTCAGSRSLRSMRSI